MSEKLKPCPFCGARAREGACHSLSGTMEIWVECANMCGASVRKSSFLDRSRHSSAEIMERGMQLVHESRTAWNNRKEQE